MAAPATCPKCKVPVRPSATAAPCWECGLLLSPDGVPVTMATAVSRPPGAVPAAAHVVNAEVVSAGPSAVRVTPVASAVATPVTATPVTATPVTATPATAARVTPISPPPAFQNDNDYDDEDDDRPRRSPRRAGGRLGKGKLPLLIGGAVVAALVVIGGGVGAYMLLGGSSLDWQRVTLPDGGVSVELPKDHKHTPKPTSNGTTSHEYTWETKAGDGVMTFATVPYPAAGIDEMIVQQSMNGAVRAMGNMPKVGQFTHNSAITVPGARYAREAKWVDSASGVAMVIRIMSFRGGAGGQVVVMMAGGPGISTADQDHFFESLTVGSANPLSTPPTVIPNSPMPAFPPPTFPPPTITPPTITPPVRPFTPPITPPVVPYTPPTRPYTPPPTRPFPPPFTPPTRTTPVPPSGPAAPAFVTQLEPFLAAVELPGRKELLTFAIRVEKNNPAGVARRYRLPDFTLLGTYHLPAAVTLAAADEANGRLLVAGVTRPDPLAAAQPMTERVVAYGDAQVYNLADLTADAAEPKPVQPTQAVSFAGISRIVGLELSPDGKTGYATLVYPTSTGRTKVWRSRVERIDVAGGKAVDRLVLPRPVWQSAINRAGDRLVLADHAIDANGYIAFTPGDNSLTVVDLKTFTVSGTPIRLPGPAVDMEFVDADRLLVAAATPAGVRVMTVTGAAGAPVDATPPDWSAAQVGSVAWAAGRLVSSAFRGSGVSVYDAADLTTPRQFRGLSTTRQAGGRPIGGRFVLVDGGRYSAFQSGQVLDTTATVPGSR